MKKRYYFLGFLFFLFYGCRNFFGGCLEYKEADDWPESPINTKKITIINRTDKEYKENFLRSVCAKKSKSYRKWKLHYESRKIKYERNKKSYVLVIYEGFGCAGDSYEDLFLLSLDNGNRKIFFGAHDYSYARSESKENDETCKYDFVRWKIHPVWQEKDLTINIYEDKITFSDPKIKETKKLKLTKTEEVDPNTLPLVEN